MFIGYAAMNAKLYPKLTKNLQRLEASATRLATGDKTSAQGSAGILGYSSSLRGKARGAQNLLASIEFGLAYATAQETVMNRIMDIAVSLSELASSATDANKTSSDLSALHSEFAVLVDEIQAYQTNTVKYNGKNLISTATSYRYGISTTATLNLTALVLSGFAKTGFSVMSITSNAKATVVLASMGRRIGSLAKVVAQASEHVNRLQTTLAVAKTFIAGLEAVDAGIRNVDIATETAEYISAQMQVEATQAIFAYNNANIQNVMRFFEFN